MLEGAQGRVLNAAIMWLGRHGARCRPWRTSMRRSPRLRQPPRPSLDLRPCPRGGRTPSIPG
eukprot:160992-Rhodomonas_salina.1